MISIRIHLIFSIFVFFFFFLIDQTTDSLINERESSYKQQMNDYQINLNKIINEKEQIQNYYNVANDFIKNITE